MQRIELIGNLGKDGELKYTQSNKKVCDTSLAVNEKIGENTITTWFNLRSWGETADRLSNLKKGDEVFVVGKLRNEKYTTKEGIDKAYTYILIDFFKKIEQKKAEQQVEYNETDYPFY